MFLRLTRTQNRCYVQVVYNKRINGVSKTFMVSSLGRYEEQAYREAKRRLEDWGPLERAPALIRELQKGDL